MGEEFRRFEFKYPIREQLIPAIRNHLVRYGMQHSAGAFGNERNAYTVTSLYFDTPERMDYEDKSGGILERKKVRIRIYDSALKNDTKALFIEKKMKYDMLVHKVRTALSIEEYDAIQRGNWHTLRNRCEHDGILHNISRSILREGAKPHIIVQYEREPLMSPHQPHFRITFNSNLTACKSPDLRYTARTRRIAPGWAVMELKYDMFLPAWFRTVPVDFDLCRDTYSKYALALEAVRQFYPIPR